jgi:hypothetical protein
MAPLRDLWDALTDLLRPALLLLALHRSTDLLRLALLCRPFDPARLCPWRIRQSKPDR